MSLKINKREFKKWIKALDSGEYKQGYLQLQDNYGYCCLGLGCKVTIPDALQFKEGGRLVGTFPNEQPAAPDWLSQINLDFFNKTDYPLAKLNDSMGFTFPEIATLLELVYVHKMLD